MKLSERDRERIFVSFRFSKRAAAKLKQDLASIQVFLSKQRRRLRIKGKLSATSSLLLKLLNSREPTCKQLVCSGDNGLLVRRSYLLLTCCAS